MIGKIQTVPATLLFAATLALAWPVQAQMRAPFAVLSRQTGPATVLHPTVPTEIFLTEAAGGTRQLTRDGLRKQLPVVSPEGGRIAYVLPDVADAASHLVIIDLRGRRLADIAIEPKSSAAAYIGNMTGIDRVEWLGAGNKIAVRGWINPSQAHFYVLDATTGATLADFIDDNGRDGPDSAAAFSRDGSHFAYVTGLPHFSGLAEDGARHNYEGRPALAIDYTPKVLANAPYRFIAPLAWSPARNILAALTQDAKSGAVYLVTAEIGVGSPRFSQVAVPAHGTAPLRMDWSRDGRLAISQERPAARAVREAWVFNPVSGKLVSLSADAVDAFDTARGEIAAARAAFATRLGAATAAADIYVPGSVSGRVR